MRFAWAQPITCIGFFVASILLIILVGIAAKEDFRPSPASAYALTQAWYYACWAAGLYLIITILMTITVYGALAGKYPKQFELNGSQRTLMLQTTAFMVYLVGGAAVYTRLEHWSYPDAVFWADVTLLTIGFGTPLVPVTHAGRSLLIPYVFGGLIAVGLVIGSIRAMLLEAGSVKMHARTTEKKRQKLVTQGDAEEQKHRFSRFRKTKKQPSQRADTQYKSERDRRRQEFLAMRKIQANAENERKWMALGISSTIAAGMWGIGAVVFWKAEYAQGWTYFESLYFSFVSLTTLGYGDLEPYSNSGKAFFVLWSLLAIPTLTVLVSDLGGTIVKLAADATALVGSLTVAPTEKEVWRRLRRNIDIVFGQNRHVVKDKKYKDSDDADQGSSSGNSRSNSRTEDSKLAPTKTEAAKKQLAMLRQDQQSDSSRLGRWPDLLYARLSSSDRDAIDSYARNCTEPAAVRDKWFYRFLLAKESRAILRDSQTHKNKTYTYDEWAYFLRLLGHDEETTELHTKQYNRPKKDNEPGTQVGRIWGHDGERREWSWLSLRSPLLSAKSEPEWVLDQLMRKLQGELDLRQRGKGDPDSTVGPGGNAHFDMLRFTRRPDSSGDGSGSGSGSPGSSQSGNDDDDDDDGNSTNVPDDSEVAQPRPGSSPHSATTKRNPHDRTRTKIKNKLRSSSKHRGRNTDANPEAERDDLVGEPLGKESTEMQKDNRRNQKKEELSEAKGEAREE